MPSIIPNPAEEGNGKMRLRCGRNHDALTAGKMATRVAAGAVEDERVVILVVPSADVRRAAARDRSIRLTPQQLRRPSKPSSFHSVRRKGLARSIRSRWRTQRRMPSPPCEAPGQLEYRASAAATDIERPHSVRERAVVECPGVYGTLTEVHHPQHQPPERAFRVGAVAENSRQKSFSRDFHEGHLLSRCSDDKLARARSAR